MKVGATVLSEPAVTLPIVASRAISLLVVVVKYVVCVTSPKVMPVADITGTGANSVNATNLTSGVTSTASTIPFGTLTAGTPKVAAQDITVTTNASSGYTVTASHSANSQGVSAPLISGATNNIDPFSGTNASPVTWSSPAGSTGNTNTGYFGYTTEDSSLCSGTAGRFGSNKWAGSTTIGTEVACSTTGVSSETTRVGYQIEVNNVQPPGSYSGTVILVATPTY